MSMVDSIRALRRSEDDRLIAGVCGGVARRLAIDPTLVRLAFLLLAFAKGIGFLLYLGLWVLVPMGERGARRWRGVARTNLHRMGDELGASAQHLRRAWERRRPDPRTWPRPLDRRWIAIGLIGLGSLLLIWSFGLLSWLDPVRSLGVVAILGGGAALLSLEPRKDGFDDRVR